MLSGRSSPNEGRRGRRRVGRFVRRTEELRGTSLCPSSLRIHAGGTPCGGTIRARRTRGQVELKVPGANSHGTVEALTGARRPRKGRLRTRTQLQLEVGGPKLQGAVRILQSRGQIRQPPSQPRCRRSIVQLRSGIITSRRHSRGLILVSKP